MTSSSSASGVPTQRLPLHDLHLAHGAHLTPFAGYDMPAHYSAGVLKEHLHTRNACGLFDVSHMGQIAVEPLSGKMGEAARALEALMPIDLDSLKPNRQRYALLTNDAGGIRDDLMIANYGSSFLLVVNASNKNADAAHLTLHLSQRCRVTVHEDRALLALQGPMAESVLRELAPAAGSMRFMDAGVLEIAGAECFVTRSGYTGEDGYEISIPGSRAQEVAESLLKNSQVMWVGLGARDSLRLEAGLCLHGNDIDPETTPVEASLAWSIAAPRRRGGPKAGGFPGAEQILSQLERGSPRTRVGLRPASRPVRAGAPIFLTESADQAAGRITSGGFGPTLNGPLSMGYVPTSHSQAGTTLFAEVRGQRHPMTVVALPFVPHHYKR